LKEQTHQIKKTIFGWVILLYPKLPSEFVFKFGGIFLCPFFGQLQYSIDVMDIMTRLRNEWGLKYPEEE
jgi:hypothetical protein